MGKNNVIIGSKFQPLSFAEILQPYQIYQQEYNRQEELYNTFLDNAGLIGAELNPTLDKDIIENVYNPYFTDLNNAAGDMSKGLSRDTRRNLQILRRRFADEMVPIKIGSDARKKAMEKWDRMLESDRSTMTNANPYYKGVSDYMYGKSPEATYVSGKELYKRGAALSTAFSKILREVPEDRRKVFEGQYWEIVKQYGPNSEQASAFLRGQVDAIPELANQIEDILSASGIYTEGFTDADKAKARQYVIEGMKAGLSGNTEVQYLKRDIPQPTIPQYGGDDNPFDISSSVNTIGEIPKTSYRDLNKLQEQIEEYNTYETINYNGKDVLVSPNLKAAYTYITDGEYRKNYDAAREREINDLNQKYKAIYENNNKYKLGFRSIDNLSTSFEYQLELNDIYNRYPEIDTDKTRKQIEKQIKKNKELEDNYSYISSNPDIYKTGLNYSKYNNTKVMRDYNIETDPTDYDKLLKTINNSSYSIYDYDTNRHTIGKRPISEARKKKEINESNPITKLRFDEEYRLIGETKNGDTYYIAGDDEMQQKNKRVNTIMNALTSFDKEDTSSKEIPSYGIGELENRVALDTDYINTLRLGTRIDINGIGEMVKDGKVTPIMVKGEILGYKVKGQNIDTDTPVNIILDPTGVVIGKMNYTDLINGNDQSLYERSVTDTYLLANNLFKKIGDNYGG